jgi:hypothetical protein
MPGRNGMGPNGEGPMTGRAAGLCNPGRRSKRQFSESDFEFVAGNRGNGTGQRKRAQRRQWQCGRSFSPHNPDHEQEQ